MRSFVTASVVWVALLAAWFLFAYQISVSELLAGALASSITLFALHRSLLAAPLEACFHLRWFATLRDIPGATVEGIGLLLSTVRSHLQEKTSGAVWQGIPFRPAGDNQEKGGRRALVVLLTTITPSCYVIDIDRETHLMLTHTLKNTPVPELVRELEADGRR